MKAVDGYVECEFEGAVHTDEPDPYGYGPQHPVDYELPDSWELRINRDYGNVKLMYYTCPGPHRKLWAGAEI